MISMRRWLLRAAAVTRHRPNDYGSLSEIRVRKSEAGRFVWLGDLDRLAACVALRRVQRLKWNESARTRLDPFVDLFLDPADRVRAELNRLREGAGLHIPVEGGVAPA